MPGRLILLALLVAGCAERWSRPPEPEFGGGIRATYRGGPVSGFLQTPTGGRPGTTSPQRPTLKEIGVDTAHEADLDFRFEWGHHGIVFENAFLFLYGNATLAQDLTTQGSLFPAGTAVDSKTFFTLHSLAYRYTFPVRLGERDVLKIAPGAGLSAFRFNYDLTGSNGAAADRSYSQLAPALKLGLAWRPGGNPRWRLTADVSSTIPVGGGRKTDLFDVAGRVHYDLSKAWSLHVETGYRHIGFEDTQTVPNHLDVDFGPWVGLGVTFLF